MPRFAWILCLAAPMLRAQPNQTAWDILNQGLAAGKTTTRQQAVAAIGSIGDVPQAVQLVGKSLQDRDPTVRQTAAATLDQMKAHAAIPALRQALDDEAPEVAFGAAKALWDLGDHSGAFILHDVLTGERKGSPGFVEGNIRDAKRIMHDPKALAMMGVNEASGALLGPFSLGITAVEGAMKDSGAPGRILSATLLAEDCNQNTREVLLWSLDNDKNWLVRASVARALGTCGNKELIPSLDRYLGDTHDSLRLMAAASVVKLSLEKPARPHRAKRRRVNRR